MIDILIILLIIAALGGFGHTGYHRGWYGNRSAGMGGAPVTGGWHGGGLGVFLLIVVVLLLLFGGGGAGVHTGPY